MKEFERSGEYSLVAVTEWYLQRAFSSVETIASLLRVRHLGATFSDSITLDGPKGGGIGFRNAEVVTYPLSGRTLADGVGDEALRRICPNLEGAVALWKVVARDELARIILRNRRGSVNLYASGTCLPPRFFPSTAKTNPR